MSNKQTCWKCGCTPEQHGPVPCPPPTVRVIDEELRIVATVTDCVQVGINEHRDINRSKVFGPNDRFSDVIKWAKSIHKNHDFHSIRFSTVEEC